MDFFKNPPVLWGITFKKNVQYVILSLLDPEIWGFELEQPDSVHYIDNLFSLAFNPWTQTFESKILSCFRHFTKYEI